MRLFRQLLIFLFVLPAGIVSGQETGLPFTHLTTQDGLSNNTVYAINEDTLGFIWIGTRSGLNRFDGFGFRLYDNSDGLRNTYINTIFRDSRGRIWVGTQGGGLSRYEYETGTFTSFVNDTAHVNSVSDDDIQAIVEDNRHRLWLGTHEGGLNCLDLETDRITRVAVNTLLPAGFRISRINTMLFECDTLIWIGTLDGLYTFNPETNHLAPFLANGKPLNTRILTLFNEVPGRLWAGTQNGIIRLDKITHKADYLKAENRGLSSDMVVDIKKSPEGQIMIATDGGGLNIYDPETSTIQVCLNNPNSSNSLSNNSVYTIFYDHSGGLWIGNYIGGLNYYSPSDWKFQPVRHELNDPSSLSDNHVRCFFQDRAGDLWIGTLGGLNRWDAATGKFTAYMANSQVPGTLASNSVLTVYEDHDGQLWVGTFGGGISILNRKSGRFTQFRHPGDPTGSLEKANVYSIMEVPGNQLCIASLGGIYLLDRNRNRLQRFMSSNSRLSNNTVKTLCRDRAGNIWAGTNMGINRLNPVTGEITVYLHSLVDSNSLSNNRVLSIISTPDGKLWIGTEGGGVSVLDPVTGRFRTITTREGLPDNVINSVLADDHGGLWFATNKGLVRYEVSSGNTRLYTSADGLQANEFNQNAALKTKDGTLCFGGINGFNRIDPGSLATDIVPPRVILTDLYISNRLVTPSDEQSPLERQLFLEKRITLGYQTSFGIYFSTPGLVNRGKYQYSYCMKGLTDEWTDFHESRTAIYSNLAPGNYVFMVRARNNDGMISASPATIEVRVLPPWWKTWWAYGLYALIILGLLFLFMRFNVSWLHVKNQLILERKEKEQMEELNQMKLGFFTNISHEFKTPLTLILGYIDNLKSGGYQAQPETLQNIEKNSNRLLVLINQLLEFRKAENGLMKLKTTKGNIALFLQGIAGSFEAFARMKSITLEYQVQGPVPEIWFDAEKVEKIMYNLLSNAVKFVGPGGNVTIRLSAADPIAGRSDHWPKGFVEIVVSDNGRGMSRENLKNLFNRIYQESKAPGDSQQAEGSGIGLAYSRKLVELHHGEITAASEEGVGTSFVIRLPAGKEHLADEEIREEVNFELKMDYQGLASIVREESILPDSVIQEGEGLPILLVVDDNPMICQVIADKFRSEYQVITAADGIRGLEQARKHVPDIIISDILMPGMDGIEFCRQIKEDILTCHIPVIMLTAKSDDDSQLKGITTGADAYIAKPYNPGILSATLRNLVNSRKVLRNKFYGKEQFIPAEVVSNKMDEKFLQKLIGMIEESAEAETIDIALLCREMAMSRSALYRKLKALSGNSIQDFIRMVKLRKASRMLMETDMPISEIAYTSGFPNTKHFSTTFKKQFGKTPTEFRNRS